jgi:hypothetical protein
LASPIGMGFCSTAGDRSCPGGACEGNAEADELIGQALAMLLGGRGMRATNPLEFH